RAGRRLLRVRQRHRPRPRRLPLRRLRAQVHQAGPLADAGRGPERVAPGLDGRLSVAVPYGVVVDSVKVSALLEVPAGSASFVRMASENDGVTLSLLLGRL